MDDICHIIMAHHILNDYYPKQLIYNDFKVINHFLSFMITILVINLIIYLKVSINESWAFANLIKSFIVL
jgi:hypothetical protein